MKRQAISFLTLIGSVFLGVSRGQTPIYTWFGPAANSGFGGSLTIVGDVDADGYDDLAIGYVDFTAIFSGRTGLNVHTFFEGGGASFGYPVRGAGDVNLDGFPDLMVGAFNYDWPTSEAGAAFVYSGHTGQKLYEFFGDSSGDQLGRSLSGAGDVNADGYADIVVGAWHDDFAANNQGSVRVYSGQTGAELHKFWGDPIALQDCGWAVSGVGDINLDGFDDVLYGSFAGSYARVRSGSSGALLLEVLTNSWSFGHALIGTGDLTVDGIPDFVVGDEGYSTTGSATTTYGAVHVCSGTSGNIITTLLGDTVFGNFGWTMDRAGDVDQDGRADFVVGSQPKLYFPVSTEPGYAKLISGASLQPLLTFHGNSVDDLFGIAVAGGGDVNGDGVLDLVVGAGGDGTVFPNAGKAQVFSSKPLALASDNYALQVSLGGIQTLRLNAQPQYAGSVYLLLGSLSGAKPGLPVDGLTLPLNYDSYVLYTLTHPNGLPLSGSLGVLSATGTALAHFTLPPGAPAPLVGLTAEHAYVVLGPSSVTFTSNAVPLSFLP